MKVIVLLTLLGIAQQTAAIDGVLTVVGCRRNIYFL